MSVFSDGFENNNFSAWTSAEADGTGSVAVSSGGAHHGSYKAVFVTGGVAGYAEADKSGINIGSTGYLRAYYQFVSGLPASDNDILVLGGLMSDTYYYGAFAKLKRINGQLYWGIDHYEAGNEQETYEATPSNPTTGTWYCIEIKRDVSASSNQMQLWINGDLRVTVNRSISGNNNFAAVGVGWKSYSAPASMYVDCVVASNTQIGEEGSQQQYSLTISVTPASSGTTNPTAGTYSINAGTYQQVSANANSAYTFDHWILDSSNAGSTNPISVLMNVVHTLQAVFIANSGSGSGDQTVTGDLTVNGAFNTGVFPQTQNFGTARLGHLININQTGVPDTPGSVRLQLGGGSGTPYFIVNNYGLDKDLFIVGNDGTASFSNLVRIPGGNSDGPGMWFSSRASDVTPTCFGNSLGVGLNSNWAIVLNAGGGGVITAYGGNMHNTLDDGSGNIVISGNATLGSGALVRNNSQMINTVTQPVSLELPTYSQYKQAYSTHSFGNILFKDTSPLPQGATEDYRYPAGRYTSLYLVMVENPDPNNPGQFDPIIASDHGLWIEKDIQTYGALFTSSDPGKGAGGGAILIGHGLTKDLNYPNDDPPRIILMDAEQPANLPTSKGYFDTLYITKRSTPKYTTRDNIENWKLGNLSVGSIRHPFTVGSGGVTTGQIVALAGDGTVVPANFYTNGTTVIGVATDTKAAGEKVPVIIWGLARVAVDMEINPGDRICASNVTAGKALAFNSHYHQLVISSTPFSGNTQTVNSGLVIGKALTHGTPTNPGYVDMIVAISG